MNNYSGYQHIIFVYGLLRKGTNHSMSRFLKNRATFISRATTQGKLFLIDNYPGLVTTDDSSDIVYGDVFGFNDPSIWTILDEFEETNISNEYNRQEIIANIPGAKVKCWAYLYQRNTDKLPLISSGDFIFYLSNYQSQKMEIQTWHQGAYTCTTDKSLLQTDLIHQFLSERSYWAKGRTIDQVKRSIQHSLSFGVYNDHKQVAFARVVTDFTVYAYILDVFVIEDERGNGLGKFLMKCITDHPDLQELKRWMLGTEDAHGLYEQYGFTCLKKVENHMEKVKS